MIISRQEINGVELLTGENDDIRFEVAPAMGGKITSVYNKKLEKEFLWRNQGLNLAVNNPGTDYDTHFWGGIDELLPNDIPETVDGIDYPDHGELWTSPLDYKFTDNRISVYGTLEKSGLYYEKAMSFHADAPKIELEYRIVNQSGERRSFLWKLHAALNISAGDKLMSNASKARIVYPQSSRFVTQDEFSWPFIEGIDASVVPENNRTMDFFYLYDSPDGTMGLVTDSGKYLFSYSYDQSIFPYQWYFASYGKFLNHYAAILEPASAMPVSINEAASHLQCSVLEPDEEINTIVTIYAGENKSGGKTSPMTQKTDN